MSNQPDIYDLVTTSGILDYDKLLSIKHGEQMVRGVLSHLPSDAYFFEASLVCYESIWIISIIACDISSFPDDKCCYEFIYKIGEDVILTDKIMFSTVDHFYELYNKNRPNNSSFNKRIMWKSVDGRDYASSNGSYVFRLKLIQQVTKVLDNKSKFTEDAYQLEIRKKGQANFNDLGYRFFWHFDGFAEPFSVNQIYWRSIPDILTKSNEILNILGYVSESESA